MAFCSQCGARLSDNQKFCSECGTPQTVREVTPSPVSAPGENRTTYVPFSNDESMDRTIYVPRRENPQPRQPVYEQPRQRAYEQPRQFADPWQEQQNPQKQHQPLDAGNEKKPPKKKGRLWALILALLLIAGAVAFFLLGGMGALGDGNEKDENDEEREGVYNAVSCIYEEEEQDVDGEWLELKAGGKGKLMMDDETFSFKWELDDEDLTIIQKGDTYEGTLEDDVIVIDINGMEYTYILEDSDAEAEWEEHQEENNRPKPAPTEAPEAPVPVAPAAPEPPAPSNIEYWLGDYYGWWVINTVYEGDPNDEGLWWDCCARIEADDYGNYIMTVWDEDGSVNEELGELYMAINIVDGDVASYISLGGMFGGVGVEFDQWSCRSDADVYDQTFWITSTYDNGEGLAFEYTFYMRPWGVMWNDVEESEPEYLPGYYHWYQELLAMGYTEAPDYIGGY